jgi:hypothetical protein
MTLGTAQIASRQGLYIVTWMNVGSFLHNLPRAFRTASEAEQFCFERNLRIVG